jgi:predicted alpha/beta superfamily hydrolase
MNKAMRILATTAILFFISALTFAQTDAPKQTKKIKPFVLGVIDEIYSTELKENRVLNIYLPAGYKKEDAAGYPVIYLLDGSADEDFIHVVGLVQFNNFSWIDRIPKSIVVGIASVDRRRDFTYPTTIADDKKSFPTSGQSAKFIAFIEKELQPYIDKTYRTNKTRTIIGQSFGGLLATEILLKKPGLFDKYIIISPSIWWDNASLLEQSSPILEQGFRKTTDIYIGVGKEGLVSGKTPRVMEVDANLLADRLKKTKSKSVKVYFDYLPKEDHATISHQAVFNAFRLLYPVKSKR